MQALDEHLNQPFDLTEAQGHVGAQQEDFAEFLGLTGAKNDEEIDEIEHALKFGFE